MATLEFEIDPNAVVPFERVDWAAVATLTGSASPTIIGEALMRPMTQTAPPRNHDQIQANLDRLAAQVHANRARGSRGENYRHLTFAISKVKDDLLYVMRHGVALSIEELHATTGKLRLF